MHLEIVRRVGIVLFVELILLLRRESIELGFGSRRLPRSDSLHDLHDDGGVKFLWGQRVPVGRIEKQLERAL